MCSFFVCVWQLFGKDFVILQPLRENGGVSLHFLYRVSLHIIYIIGEYGSIADRTVL